jgi:anaerobic ribonucleoside-triphosphate reductase activating protein
MPLPGGEPDPADLRLNVALIVARTEAEGPGVRAALWVQGCTIRCPGCCNPEMLAVKDATWMTVDEALAQLPADVEGVSFLGGEPTEQARALAALARRVRARGQTVMVYSGRTIDELRASPAANALLEHTDLLVDGRYDESLRTTTRRFIGSTNQQLHFLTDRYRADDARFASHNTVELRLTIAADGTKSITMNGWPVKGARTLPIIRGDGGAS